MGLFIHLFLQINQLNHDINIWITLINSTLIKQYLFNVYITFICKDFNISWINRDNPAGIQHWKYIDILIIRKTTAKQYALPSFKGGIKTCNWDDTYNSTLPIKAIPRQCISENIKIPLLGHWEIWDSCRP